MSDHKPGRRGGSPAVEPAAVDLERQAWHDEALWQVRVKRDGAAAAVPDWESLRERASGIKDATLAHLADHLESFEARAIENGATVHWAADAAEHNEIVARILRDAGARRIVKSKSMLTEECGLNPFLERLGFEVIDTDLGERIVQLARQSPSHIVMPAIHFRQAEVGRLFEQELDAPPGESSPEELTEIARTELRKHFAEADASLTGVNFGIAATGGIVVCTNEGNADLGIHTAPIHIASMGLEKVIPGLEDLAVFLRLLARSATGQPITVYTSYIRAPRADSDLHIILVDNGRSDLARASAGREMLKCIRCGACMNTCPVFRRAGGHAYGTVIPGPIGSALAPARDAAAFGGLPFASSLCGSCTDVCPVKIDLHGLLYRSRQEVRAVTGSAPLTIRLAARAMARPRQFRVAARLLRLGLRSGMRFGPLAVWNRTRETPQPPAEPFREWYRKNRPA